MEFLAKLLGTPTKKHENVGAAPPSPGKVQTFTSPAQGGPICIDITTPPSPHSIVSKGEEDLNAYVNFNQELVAEIVSSNNEESESLSDRHSVSDQSYDTASIGVTASVSEDLPPSAPTKADTDSDTGDFESADEHSLAAITNLPESSSEHTLNQSFGLSSVITKFDEISLGTPAAPRNINNNCNPLYKCFAPADNPNETSSDLDLSIISTVACRGSVASDTLNFTSYTEEQPSFSALNFLASACESVLPINEEDSDTPFASANTSLIEVPQTPERVVISPEHHLQTSTGTKFDNLEKQTFKNSKQQETLQLSPKPEVNEPSFVGDSGIIFIENKLTQEPEEVVVTEVDSELTVEKEPEQTEATTLEPELTEPEQTEATIVDPELTVETEPEQTADTEVNPEVTVEKEPEQTEAIAVEPEVTVEKQLPEQTEAITLNPELSVEKEAPKQTEATTVEPEVTVEKEPEQTEATTVEPEVTVKKEPEQTEATTVGPEVTVEKEPEQTEATTVVPELTVEKEPEQTAATEVNPEVTVENEPEQTEATTVNPELAVEKEPEQTATIEIDQELGQVVNSEELLFKLEVEQNHEPLVEEIPVEQLSDPKVIQELGQVVATEEILVKSEVQNIKSPQKLQGQSVHEPTETLITSPELEIIFDTNKSLTEEVESHSVCVATQENPAYQIAVNTENKDSSTENLTTGDISESSITEKTPDAVENRSEPEASNIPEVNTLQVDETDSYEFVSKEDVDQEDLRLAPEVSKPAPRLSELFALCHKQEQELSGDLSLEDLLAAEADLVCQEIHNASLRLSDNEDDIMADEIKAPPRKSVSPRRNPSKTSEGTVDPFRPRSKLSNSPSRETERVSPGPTSSTNLSMEGSMESSGPPKSVPRHDSSICGPEVNHSEAGPETAAAEEPFVSSDIFKDPNTFDFLSRLGGGNAPAVSRLERESLYVKFDPLVSNRDRRVFLSPCLETSRGDNSMDESPGRPKQETPVGAVGTLISIGTPTPVKSSQADATTPLSAPKQKEVEEGPTVREVEFAKELLERQARALDERLERERAQAAEREAALRAQLEKALASENQQIASKEKAEDQFKLIMKEYEDTIAKMLAELETKTRAWTIEKAQLESERKTAQDDLAGAELAFSDLHRKYERAKEAIVALKSNEEALRKSNTEFQISLEKSTINYQKLKTHAEAQLEKANMEIDQLLTAKSKEQAAHDANIKRLKSQITSMEQLLEVQKNEKKELVSICDDLLAKMGQQTN